MKSTTRTQSNSNNWDGIVEVTVADKHSYIQGVLSKLSEVHSFVWCTQLSICLIAWLSDLTATSGPALYFGTLAFTISVPFLFSRIIGSNHGKKT